MTAPLALVGFQVVWLASAFSAANGQTAPAVAACLGYTVVAVALSRDRLRMMLLASLSAGLGLVVESLLITFGILVHVTTWPSPLPAPAWILALWFAYGATVPATHDLLGRRARLKSVLAGIVFGPLAYFAGSSVGALAIVKPTVPALVTIAILWGGTQFLLFSAGRGSVSPIHP
jgi:hypothetical protein